MTIEKIGNISKKSWKKTNKIALITGITSGIGYALCHLFARNKINLVLVSSNEEKLLHQKEELESLYAVHINIMNYDLTESNSTKRISWKLNDKKFI